MEKEKTDKVRKCLEEETGTAWRCYEEEISHSLETLLKCQRDFGILGRNKSCEN